MRKINRRFKKMIDEVIVQGNNNEIQKMFNAIFDSMRDEFTEDNLASHTSFMLENTIKSLKDYVLIIEHDYSLDLDEFGNMLKSCIDAEINNWKSGE